ncbi:MAG: hypothetical protein H3Z53_05695, partial [archaeon]|nr:hypothetical protein [archaeon]
LLSLTLGDFNLVSDPPSLTIPAYAAKNNIAREVFFTEETKVILMDYLMDKGISKPSQFLFIRKDVDPVMDEKGFQKAVKQALNRLETAWVFLTTKPIFQDLRKPIRQRYKRKRHEIHIYSFKKFAFTKIADTLGSLAAHAIAGHREYLITYYKKSRKERAEDYRKATPKLRLFTPSEDEELREKAIESVKELPKEALLEILKISKKALKR